MLLFCQPFQQIKKLGYFQMNASWTIASLCHSSSLQTSGFNLQHPLHPFIPVAFEKEQFLAAIEDKFAGRRRGE